MKTHLALGAKGRKPAPYADWSELKQKAALATELGEDAPVAPAQDQETAEDAQQRKRLVQRTAGELQDAIGIFGPLHDVIADGGAERIVRLAQALEFPTVRPSLFHSERLATDAGAETRTASRSPKSPPRTRSLQAVR